VLIIGHTAQSLPSIEREDVLAGFDVGLSDAFGNEALIDGGKLFAKSKGMALSLPPLTNISVALRA
jgi:hypothetical protein